MLASVPLFLRSGNRFAAFDISVPMPAIMRPLAVAIRAHDVALRYFSQNIFHAALRVKTDREFFIRSWSVVKLHDPRAILYSAVSARLRLATVKKFPPAHTVLVVIIFY